MRALSLTIVAVLASVSCGDPEKLVRAPAAIAFDPARLSFGGVVLGSERTLPFVVRNGGRTEDRIEVSGETPEFHVFPRSARISPGQSIEFRAVFQPKSATVARATATLRLMSTGAEEQISLDGFGLADAVDVRREFDFGPVLIGRQQTREIPVRNLTGSEILVKTTLVAPAFSSDVNFFHIPANEEGKVSIAFLPDERREYWASMLMKGCAECQWREIGLRGMGVRRVLTASRESIDFGSALPGHPREDTITLTNAGDIPISFGSVSRGGTGASAFDAQFVGLPEVLEVGESTELKVSFSPTELGFRTGVLSVMADDGDLLAQVALSGNGGGPRLEVTPAVLDFGVQPPGRAVTKTVRLENTLDPEEVAIVGVSLEGDAGGSFAVGVHEFPVVIGSEPLEVPIEFAAARGGRLEGTIVFHTDSPDQPTLSLSVTGESVPSVDCDLVAEPASIRWGLVAPTSTNLQRSIHIRNSGDSACPLWNWRVVGAGSAFFNLKVPEDDLIVLEAGEAFEVSIEPVVVAPRRVLDQASFEVSFGRDGIDLTVPLSVYVADRVPNMGDPKVVFEDTPVGRASVRSVAEMIDYPPSRFVATLSDSSDGIFITARVAGDQKVVMAPKVMGPQRGQLQVWLDSWPEALLIDLEGVGSPPCEDCGWPDASCAPPASIHPGEVVNFRGGDGVNHCAWGIIVSNEYRGKDTGPMLSRGLPRDYFLEEASPLDELACDMVFRAAAVGDFSLTNLEVRTDGRADFCQTTFHVSPPGGLFVEFIPHGSDAGRVGVKLLSGRGGPAQASESWHDADHMCWGYRYISVPETFDSRCNWERLGFEPDPIFSDFLPEGTGMPSLAFWARIATPSVSLPYHIAIDYSGDAKVRIFCGDTLRWEGQVLFPVYGVLLIGEVQFSSPSSCTFTPDVATNLGGF